MLLRKNLWAALLLVPLALMPTACRDKQTDRDALKKDELVGDYSDTVTVQTLP